MVTGTSTRRVGNEQGFCWCCRCCRGCRRWGRGRVYCGYGGRRLRREVRLAEPDRALFILEQEVSHSQGCEPKMKNGSVGFSFFHQNVGRFRSVLKTKPKKTETETERFSVGFSVKPAKKSTFQRLQCVCVGITCDDRIVWCQEQAKSYINQVRGARLY